MSDRKKVHEGRNIKRFREMLGLKQEALAYELGDEWSQKRISLLEQKESINEAILREIAKVLKMPVEAFQNFDEEQAVNVIANTFNDSSILNTGHTPTFNIDPVDKLLQLHEEKMALYERMLKEKDEIMAMLKELVENIKR